MKKSFAVAAGLFVVGLLAVPADVADRSIDDFGGWSKAQATHFADGGIFDQITQPGK